MQGSLGSAQGLMHREVAWFGFVHVAIVAGLPGRCSSSQHDGRSETLRPAPVSILSVLWAAPILSSLVG